MRIALLFLAAAAASTPALGQILTLDEARARALQGQPVLRALEHTWRAGQLNALAEGALPDPRLKLGAYNFPVRGFPDSRDDMTQLGISWEQTIPGGDKRRLRTERGHAEAGQALAESHALMQTILRDVGLAWLDAWLAAANQRLFAELAAEHARAVEAAQSALGTGKASLADLLAARQALNQVMDRRLELATQTERARAGIARWIPDAAARPLPETLPVIGEPPAIDVLRAALGAHPQHEMHAQQQALADADVALAREATKSDRTVELGYYARSGGRSDMLMFQIGFELPLFAARKQDSTLAAKLRLAERAREQRADHLRQLRAELDAAHAEWRLAGERLRHVRTAILPDASARVEALVTQYGAGGTTLASVLDARRATIEARSQELGLRAMQTRARVTLQYFEDYGAHR
jgi:cobalt-zinc-cadmium efflux system outer membrane protein